MTQRDGVVVDTGDEERPHLVGHNLKAYIADLEERMRRALETLGRDAVPQQTSPASPHQHQPASAAQWRTLLKLLCRGKAREWCAAAFGRNVRWRAQALRIGAGGRMSKTPKAPKDCNDSVTPWAESPNPNEAHGDESR